MSPRRSSSLARTHLFMPLFIRLDPGSHEALHLQVYRGIVDAIAEGRVGVGDSLPSTREFARDLRVGRNTVLRAVERLEAEGIIKGKVGSGLRVSRAVAGAAEPPASPVRKPRVLRELPPDENGAGLPFRPDVAPTDLFPDRTWARLAAQRWRTSARQLVSGNDALGYLPLRRVVAEYLGTSRGLVCHHEQVMITSGTHHALDLVLGAGAQRGDSAWVEDPCRPEVSSVLAARRIRAIPVPVDRDGFSPSLANRIGHARVAIVTPGCHWPSGVAQSLRRRQRLIEWARATDAVLVEDDHCAALRFVGRPLPTLFSLDDGARTIHMGSFANAVFPALRVGYLVVPDALHERVAATLANGAQHTPTSVQANLADFIEHGYFARHVRRLRDVLAERYTALSGALSAECGGVLDPVPASGGMHILGWLPDEYDERDAITSAEREGIQPGGVSAYSHAPSRPGLVLGFGAWDRDVLVRAAGSLARALERTPHAPRALSLGTRDPRLLRLRM